MGSEGGGGRQGQRARRGQRVALRGLNQAWDEPRSAQQEEGNGVHVPWPIPARQGIEQRSLLCRQVQAVGGLQGGAATAAAAASGGGIGGGGGCALSRQAPGHCLCKDTKGWHLQAGQHQGGCRGGGRGMEGGWQPCCCCRCKARWEEHAGAGHAEVAAQRAGSSKYMGSSGGGGREGRLAGLRVGRVVWRLWAAAARLLPAPALTQVLLKGPRHAVQGGVGIGGSQAGCSSGSCCCAGGCCATPTPAHPPRPTPRQHTPQD